LHREEFRSKNDTAAQQQMEKLCKHESEVAERQAKFDVVAKRVGAKREQMQRAQSTAQSNNARIAQLEAEAVQNETLRRQLHNTMCELKGNIRVFCRVRPQAQSEIQEAGGGTETVQCHGTTADKDRIRVVDPVARAALAERKKVSGVFPSCVRSILTEIYLCQACSCPEIENGNAWTGA
jgi:chromosome segregation ATPase